MSEETALIRQRMRTPRAAAVAGIVFSVLLMTSQMLVRISIPSDPMAAAVEVARHSKSVALAMNLLPFAGIAFLWFIAVVRDRLGELEDRFFSTVFLGSGLLYVAMMFTAAAIAGALISLLGSGSENLVASGTYPLGRAEIYRFMSVFATKMAAMFVMSTSTIFLQTRVVPRALAFLGYVLAVLLLVSIGTTVWILLVFPLWVLVISIFILIENLREGPEIASGRR